MTKTENYQLPQWEANDPLRREDFNGAMENIEAGLGGLRDGLDELWDGPILYGAERELLSFRGQADAGETPDDAHVFYNRLDTAEDAQTLTGALWSAEKHIYIGASTCITLDDIKAGCTASELGSKYNSTPACYYFTAPGNAHVTSWSFMLWTSFDSSTAGQMDVEFELRAEKQVGDEWTVLFQSGNIPVHTEGTGNVTVWTAVPVDFTIERGADYRIVVQRLTAASTTSLYGLTTTDSSPGAPYSNDIQVEFTPIAATAGSHTRELATAGKNRVLLWVRYNADPAEGGVTVLLNGTAPECAYQDGTDRNGEACRELRALAKGPFPETSALTLNLTCGETDDLRLLDYAVYLL